MASEQTRNDGNSGIGFGAREPRHAPEPRHPQSAQPAQTPQIQTAIEHSKPGARGNDPYNTSGSFDRSRNWARVGKR